MSNNKRLIVEIIDGDTVITTIDQNLLRAEFGALDRGNITDVYEWGIYVNRGSFSFIDRKGIFNHETINAIGLLNYTAKFYLVNSVSRKLIATHVIKSAQLKEETQEISIECVSNLEQWQNKKHGILFPRFPEVETPLVHNTSTADVLNMLVQKYNDDNKSDTIEILIGTEPLALEKTMIYCPYFSDNTLWHSVNQICQASMSRVFDNEEGTAVISGAFPSKTPIIVKPSNILSVENSGYTRTTNLSIEITNREKFVGENAALEGVEEHFTITYDAYGQYHHTTNADYTDVEKTADEVIVTIHKDVNAQYKINSAIVPNVFAYVTKEVYQSGYPGTPNKTFSQNVNIGNAPVSALDPSEILLGSGDTGITCLKIIGNTRERITDVYVTFKADHFRDGDTTTEKIIRQPNSGVIAIPTNDLVQGESFYLQKSNIKVWLGEYILRELDRRYGKGIECFEIECLFNDYFDENGEKVFDRDNLSRHFEKYDIIIPYVQKSGKTIPLRTNADGTPKQFRIIGISYSYNGLLKQKLQLQEERYDVD